MYRDRNFLMLLTFGLIAMVLISIAPVSAESFSYAYAYSGTYDRCSPCYTDSCYSSCYDSCNTQEIIRITDKILSLCNYCGGVDISTCGLFKELLFAAGRSGAVDANRLWYGCTVCCKPAINADLSWIRNINNAARRGNCAEMNRLLALKLNKIDDSSYAGLCRCQGHYCFNDRCSSGNCC